MILLKIILILVAVGFGVAGFILNRKALERADFDLLTVAFVLTLVSIGLVGCAVFCNF